MSKSSWKPLFIDKIFFIFLKKNKFPKIFYIKCRNSNIPKYLLNKILFVHNGLKFIKINITIKMVGQKFGSFCFTKKRGIFIHKKIKKSKTKLKK